MKHDYFRDSWSSDSETIFCQPSARALSPSMASAEAPRAISATTSTCRSFAYMILDTPQPILEVVVPFRAPKIVDGEVCVMFSKKEIENSALPFRYSIVLKFLRQRPSLDAIRVFIRSRWGLNKQPAVSSMLKPRNVFIRMANEGDFIKALTREATNIDGVIYRVFRWTTDFKEDCEPVHVPVWINLPGLPSNYYQDSFLRNIMAPVGQYVKRDNSTRCTARTEGARVCIDMEFEKNQ